MGPGWEGAWPPALTVHGHLLRCQSRLCVHTGPARTTRAAVGPPGSPHLTTGGPSLSLSQEQLVEAEAEHWLPPGAPKERRDGKKSAKLPETPKTAEEMWQHSVIGDYLAKYRVRPPPSALRPPPSVSWLAL